MENRLIGNGEDNSSTRGNKMRKPENGRISGMKDSSPGSELWKDGLICAFEFVRGRRKAVRSRSAHRDGQIVRRSGSRSGLSEKLDVRIGEKHIETPSTEYMGDLAASSDNPFDFLAYPADQIDSMERYRYVGSSWNPIGWARLSELVQAVQVNPEWSAEQFDFMEDEYDRSVADLAAPYWERPAGPVWWCHVDAGHPFINEWLNGAQWLHPAIRVALRDESKLISEKMKHLLYEVPVRVAGGILFELLGQSVGDPKVNEDDIPIVLRSWQAQNFLVTSLHVKGSLSSLNVLGITEVQELLSAGGDSAPKTVHEVIAQLASRLSRWDDRLFRKSIFGAADEIELKFMNRRNQEDMNLFSVILNQEIRRLSTQVIRVKWSLHAREEIIFELLQHLKGSATRLLLEGIRKSTREMLEEQEAVRGRLFTIQDVTQSTVRAWLQDQSLRVTHNLGVFGGCGLVLTIITGLFGINVDGIPGAANAPYAFALFSGLLVLLGVVLIAMGLVYLGLKKPISEELVEVRKLELQELVKMFQHEAETHAQVRKPIHRDSLPPTAGDELEGDPDYVIIQ
uniref:Magnesium transporter CorA-like family protein n=1 Tax=Kalanchoe fedtschenkoi TaxID=63787 RepID=A0A7N0RE44_KALFE